MLQTLPSSLGKFEPLFSGELRKFKPSFPFYKGGADPTLFCAFLDSCEDMFFSVTFVKLSQSLLFCFF